MQASLFHFTENKGLLITLGLALALAIPTVFSIAESDEELLSLQALNVHPKADLRRPASTDENISVLKSAEKKALLAKYNLHCKETGPSDLVHSGEFIQLHGEACIKEFQIQKMEIINKSNGYTASIFPTQNGKYQTDLIQLKTGANEIVIRYSDEVGKLTEEVLRATRE